MLIGLKIYTALSIIILLNRSFKWFKQVFDIVHGKQRNAQDLHDFHDEMANLHSHSIGGVCFHVFQITPWQFNLVFGKLDVLIKHKYAVERLFHPFLKRIQVVLHHIELHVCFIVFRKHAIAITST